MTFDTSVTSIKPFILLPALAVLFAVLVTGCTMHSMTGTSAQTGQDIEYEHDGMTRTYHLYKPDGLPAGAPLLFILHGISETADWSWGLDMNSLADEHGFAVCYPQGSTTGLGVTHWNARLTLSTVDDTGFLVELAGFLQDAHRFDRDRTYISGFSNGGFMAYTLASETYGVFSGAAIVSGLMSGITWDNRVSAEPLPILHIHGTADTVVPDDGSMIAIGGWGGAPAVPGIIDFWADLNATTTEESSDISTSATAWYYRQGIYGNEVWYYSIDGYGHAWPGDPRNTVDNSGFSANQLIVDFFDL
jgi:polyhydroxybutyrate depolymerase